MFKREIKTNLKGFLPWGILVTLMLILIFSIYPSIASEKGIDKLLEAFPKEVLQGFNLDIVSISTVSGWYSSEGFMIMVLIGALYSGILGSTIILKEESDNTIDFLYSKPVTRNKILISKICAGLFFVILLNIVVMIVTGIGFILNEDMHITKWLLLTLSPIIVHIAIFFITAFVSTFFSKTRKAMGTALGLVMVFYVINIIGKISTDFDWLKFFTPFGYVDATSIIKDNKLDVFSIVILIIGLVVMGLLFKRYNYKEFE